MTAEAALRLVEIASRTGVTTSEDLKSGGVPRPSVRAMGWGGHGPCWTGRG